MSQIRVILLKFFVDIGKGKRLELNIIEFVKGWNEHERK